MTSVSNSLRHFCIAWDDIRVVITLLRVTVATWSAAPVRVRVLWCHLCSFCKFTKVNQSFPSPFLMEYEDAGKLVWALRNCCDKVSTGHSGQVLVDAAISVGALGDADGSKEAKNSALAVGQCWVLHNWGREMVAYM